MLAALCASAPASSWLFLVFFEDDTTDLHPRSLFVIQEAVRYGQRVGWECARVVGASDRAGASERRQVISRLRAEAVARELVRFGAPAECVIVEACGDRFPMVPTAEGVAEVQNRQVEIIHYSRDEGPQRSLRPGPNCPWERLPGSTALTPSQR
ncbi:OmpA family protein [Roseomonas sp. F4]